MNTRAAIIALLLAVLVGAGAFFLVRPKPAPPAAQTTWLAHLDPALLESITVRWKNGRQATIEKSPMADLWLLRQGSSVWPVSARRIVAIAKLVGEIEASPVTDKAEADGVAVTFRTSGVDRTISVASGTLGGRAVVRVHAEPDVYHTVDAQVARLFEEDGLRAWRETGAFQTEDFSRIRLQTIGRQIIVARNAGRWGVQVPVVAPADQERCQALAAQLPRIQLARFIDQAPGTDDALGLNTPEAIIDTETDFRTVTNGDVERKVLVQQLKIGGPVDPAGKQHYASLSAQWLDPATRTMTPAWGPVLAAVSRENLDAISAESTQYISRKAVQAEAGDVASISIWRDEKALDDIAPPSTLPDRRVLVNRYLEAWQITMPGSIPHAPSPTEAAGIEYLVKSLCEVPADAVGREAPRGSTPLVRIRVEATGAGGDIGVGVASVAPAATPGKPPPEPQPVLVLRVGGIYRVYFNKTGVDAARWLNDLLPPEG